MREDRIKHMNANKFEMVPMKVEPAKELKPVPLSYKKGDKWSNFNSDDDRSDLDDDRAVNNNRSDEDREDDFESSSDEDGLTKASVQEFSTDGVSQEEENATIEVN